LKEKLIPTLDEAGENRDELRSNNR